MVWRDDRRLGGQLLALENPPFDIVLQILAALAGDEARVLVTRLRKLLPDDYRCCRLLEIDLAFLDRHLWKVAQSQTVIAQVIPYHLDSGTCKRDDSACGLRSQIARAEYPV